MSLWRVEQGDCVEVMRGMPEASVDAVVCDPPYHLTFMGRAWDHAPTPVESQAQHRRWADQTFRVLKPGGHLLAFGGTRTYHRLACAIEDAGFEIRDNIAWQHMEGVFCACDSAHPNGGGPSPGSQPVEQHAAEPGAVAVEWIPQGGGAWPGCPRCGKPLAPPFFGGPLSWEFGSGFPKSLDVSKAIDNAAGATRPVVGPDPEAGRRNKATPRFNGTDYAGGQEWQGAQACPLTAPGTPDAERWQGWGTALKPAHEPIVVARKPLDGTVAATVLKHGTGALNVDGCRIGWGAEGDKSADRKAKGYSDAAKKALGGVVASESESGFTGEVVGADSSGGRWPANVCFDESAAAMLDAQTGNLGVSQGGSRGAGGQNGRLSPIGAQPDFEPGYGDSGGASRFFYCAKSSSAERNAGLDGFEDQRKPVGMHSIRSRECNVCGIRTKQPGKPWPICGHEDWRWVEVREERHHGQMRNSHPTVKPIDLMRWLVRLVTPHGGFVLDPFTGSGTTGCAAVLEGFRFVGIEREAEYADIARARIGWWSRHPDGVELVRALEAERERGRVRDAGQLDMFGEEMVA